MKSPVLLLSSLPFERTLSPLLMLDGDRAKGELEKPSSSSASRSQQHISHHGGSKAAGDMCARCVCGSIVTRVCDTSFVIAVKIYAYLSPIERLDPIEVFLWTAIVSPFIFATAQPVVKFQRPLFYCTR